MTDIKIKNAKIFEHLMHPKAVELLDWLATWFPGELVITKLWAKGGSGIHATRPLRAFDVRSRHLSGRSARDVEKIVNRTWIYDPQRPHLHVCWYHYGTAWHFHFQVHERTSKREFEYQQ